MTGYARRQGMSPLERSRKIDHRCTRCGVKLTARDHTNLCEDHRLDVNARMRASYWRRRGVTVHTELARSLRPVGSIPPIARAA